MEERKRIFEIFEKLLKEKNFKLEKNPDVKGRKNLSHQFIKKVKNLFNMSFSLLFL